MKRYTVLSSWIDHSANVDNQHAEEFDYLISAVWYWLMVELGLREEANPWSSCIFKDFCELRIKIFRNN